MKLAMQYEGWLREAGAGFISACLTLPLCVGAGVLAFAPLGADTVPEAAQAGLLCAILGGAVAALVRRSSFVVSYPTTPICVIQGSILLGLTALPGVTGSTLVLAMTLCVLLAGLWQLLFAYTGMARAMRFVPHPVMAGFVTGVAALIAWHQVPVLLGPGASGWRVGTLFPHPWATLFGGGLVAFMLVLGRTFRKVPNLLAGLLVGTAGFHVLGHLLPTTDLGGVIGSVPPHALRVLPLRKLILWASARSLARWITGPSAIGSEKGTPSSMMSAPALTISCMAGTVKPGLGSPAVMNGISALRPACLRLSSVLVIRLTEKFLRVRLSY